MSKPLVDALEARPRRFRPYPEYKDSGVEWLGTIPKRWEVKRLKQLFRVVNGSTPKSGEPDYWDGDIPWVTPDDLGKLGETDLHKTARSITRRGYENCGTSMVPAGSLILSTRAPIGHLAIAGVPLCTNQGCRSLVFRESHDHKFFYFQVLAARPILESMGRGSTFKELANDDLGDLELCVPGTDDQRAISIFLDRETAKIGALVTKKERLIELLEEKRTALITRAVTKGLEPSVPMKDSGVEWLGEIPVHWEVKKLKGVSSLQTGVTLGKRYESERLEVRPYLRVANVQDGYLDLDDIAEIAVPRDEAGRYGLRSGDVLMTEGGDFDKLGRGYVWEGQIPGCLHQNHIFAVRPDQAELRSDFLAAVMSSGYGRAYFTATSKQSTNLASTNSAKLKNFPIALPERSEQEEILHFVAIETGRLDHMAARVKDGIERFKEFRSALISAAVTGKIDVREEAA